MTEDTNVTATTDPWVTWDTINEAAKVYERAVIRQWADVIPECFDNGMNSPLAAVRRDEATLEQAANYLRRTIRYCQAALQSVEDHQRNAAIIRDPASSTRDVLNAQIDMPGWGMWGANR